jgi:predicted CoA-binding protein
MPRRGGTWTPSATPQEVEMGTKGAVVHEDLAERFVRLRRIAVVGASADKGNFGGAVVRAFRQRGTQVAVVHPSGHGVDDAPGYTDLASVPGDVEGVLVMVPAPAAADVVRACAARGVPLVWLFRGIGGRGSVSDEALAVCEEHGIDVVAGACPLMFLEPVGVGHRLHRTIRRRRGGLTRP